MKRKWSNALQQRFACCFLSAQFICQTSVDSIVIHYSAVICALVVLSGVFALIVPKCYILLLINNFYESIDNGWETNPRHGRKY